MTQTAINYMMLRGGSSKGLYFNAADLPSDTERRDQILLDALGRDARQIDGLGGGTPLTSKAALVSVSSQPDCDLDYLFCQVVVGENRVDTAPNCGNILAGVGPFAIESGMLKAQDGETRLRIYMVNSGKECEVIIQTPNRRVEYTGSASISGVLGTAAPIVCNYFELAGSACGQLFPTGNTLDTIDGVDVTCIDNGMPVVLLNATDFDISGYETPAELDANQVLKARLQSIRLQLGPLMGLGNVDGAAVPKMCLISPPQGSGIVNTRTFIPYKCHDAIGVLGAVSVATACLAPKSVATGVATLPASNADGSFSLSVEHPSGEFTCVLNAERSEQSFKVTSAGLVRTARLLSRGQVYLPATD
ncbi:4-oxalomesaconate tautomerase [Arenicella xantha]|uniref:4-oxalomesaconate tautomerase n=1 Tax=Arenicella xantha TaxID=644221 RepID=A0A395JEW2_9GAMM|nr:4-oxalomesaconate tautomerase [Arenicella xantha]RBP47159.1 4-oxalomesaconate tautomerase [Arenicella xantha]